MVASGKVCVGAVQHRVRVRYYPLYVFGEARDVYSGSTWRVAFRYGPKEARGSALAFLRPAQHLLRWRLSALFWPGWRFHTMLVS